MSHLLKKTKMELSFLAMILLNFLLNTYKTIQSFIIV